jgi:hypothetical protein
VTALGALGARLDERLSPGPGIGGHCLPVDTRNATGPLGALGHVIRI